MGDFSRDWGPSGYYGPVKSYEILRATGAEENRMRHHKRRRQPVLAMPGANDRQKRAAAPSVSRWVDSRFEGR